MFASVGADGLVCILDLHYLEHTLHHLILTLCWNKQDPNNLATMVMDSWSGVEDHQALIWDIQQMPQAIKDPILSYTVEGEINNVQWASIQPNWIAACYNNCLEILRV
eukprot:superscaffoldBa00000660_g6388